MKPMKSNNIREKVGRLTRRVIASIMAVSLLVVILPATTASAIAAPDYFAARGAYAFPSVKAPGDMGFLISYTLSYTILPSESATEAFMISLIDVGGTDIIASVAPYALVTSGYGRGLVWIYLDADKVAAYGLTPASAVTIRIDGNPLLVWDAGSPPAPTSIPITYWYTTSTIHMLGNVIRSTADNLDVEWGLGYSLGTTTSDGWKLSTFGETYYMNVIPGLRTFVPNVFSAGELTTVTEVIEYGAEHSNSLLTNLINTPFDMPNLALAFGLTYNTGNVTTTNGSSTVSGIGTRWTKSMIGRQLNVSADGRVYYMIDDVDEDNQRISLTRPYIGATAVNRPYDLVNTLFLTSALWLVGMFFLMAGVVKITNKIRPAILLSIPCIISGALLGALAPQVIWAAGTISAVSTVLILLFKPSAS